MIPAGFCQCGCGSPTDLAERTHSSRGWIKGRPKRYLFNHHLKKYKGENHGMYGRVGEAGPMWGMRAEQCPTWNGGRRKDGRGYMRAYAPNHPNRSVDGYVYEHRLIMEKELGRLLSKEEIVHHIDGDRMNNIPSNLQVMSSADHTRLHSNERWEKWRNRLGV